MASLGNPRTWIPYMNTNNCSQESCSFYCPQCHSPLPQPFQYHDSNPKFSPLIISIIGVISIVILLLSYYTIMSKYYSNRENNHDPNDELLQHNNHIHNLHVSTSTTTTTTRGLDENLIKSIMICKYKKGNNNNDGFVGFIDCSVCLSEFEDDESVRVLPKCDHVFHIPCIDAWLKSHSTCPLCRANIFNFNASPLQASSSVVIEMVHSRNQMLSENQHAGENIIVESDTEIGAVEGETTHITSHPSKRAFSDLGTFQQRHTIIQIRDELFKSIRSISMDHSLA
ncbi:PREDICTED: RING-H2 finger protein ATL52-like isoform X2 [Lupinus angustifolius]|uniref:RING-H2 finger protein ATL52-like isoform X2 n=1 Tax=Lupinus angustifolius TaxID=3871 RepID=UPI00092E7D10|nr:PREDICTED: RING-H2 finger protein ATL52-like isoform X2 [Lupinus angustifolius]